LKSAFITGITGQDGRYLSNSLLSDGYKVVGLSRDPNAIVPGATMVAGDVSDPELIDDIIKNVRPQEVYNLAGIHHSHHRESESKSSHFAAAIKTNTTGPLNILKSISHSSPDSRFFQAGSSEVFDKSFAVQTITTPMKSHTAYGCSKIMAKNIVDYYRECEGIFATNGFLFNHESPYRSQKFVTTKIVRTAVRIYLGIDKTLRIGSLESQRDWGHAKDYVNAMRLAIQYKEPKDWIIASGCTKTIEQLCNHVFLSLGMNYDEYVIEDPTFKKDIFPGAAGDISITKKDLGWEPSYTFEQMLDEMIKYWIEMEKKNG